MRTLAVAALLLLGAREADAQDIEARVGRFYHEDGWTVYRLGLSRPLFGPFATSVQGSYTRRVGGAGGAFAGLGLDLTAFRGGQGPYLVAGIGGGLGSPHSQEFSSFWGGWSAGAGYELLPASFLRVGIEGRWREISLDRRDGLELGAGVAIGLGGRRKRATAPGDASPSAREPGSTAPDDELPPLTTTLPATPRVRGAAAETADSVIATATEVMGRPYRYGGTGSDGGGFDCSGLIQYAYGRHGITLPRVSTEQAREGREVPRSLAALLPGDLLTFSNRGGPVTHVGLYLGDGRFIHSATRGVQASTLSADDPYGRWWFARWVGARRIVE